MAPRITLSIWGRPKVGKTWFALTFPDPIAFLEVGESGSEHLLGKFADKKIHHLNLQLKNLTPTSADHEALLRTFETEFLKAVHPESGYKTLVIDSASKLWLSVRTVKVEEQAREKARTSTKKMLTDYELANIYFEQIVHLARQKPDLNIVLVHRDREIWEGEETDSGGRQMRATGKFEPREFKDIGFLAQVTIHAGREWVVTDVKKGIREEVPAHTIERCAMNTKLHGLRPHWLDYEKLVARIWPEEVVSG